MINYANVEDIVSISDLIKEAKWLEGKTLREISASIKKSDNDSRVTTKGNVGYIIEKGYFGIEMNSNSQPDIKHLGVEIKTCPLRYKADNKTLTVKEPLSLNIINYNKEIHQDIRGSALYKKNRKILFVFYIHDNKVERSDYIIKYVFLWEITQDVIDELQPDYKLIVGYIKAGKAHEIHQYHHKFLTICPKHGGKFKDPLCNKSKRPQPYSSQLAEIRAFRFKNSYVNLIIERYLNG